MTLPNWTDMNWYYYLAAGGGVVVVLALVLYFLPFSRIKVPGIFLGIIGGLGTGAALGILALGSFGYHWNEQPRSEGGGPPPGMPPGGGGPPGGMGGMMAMMGGGGGPKTQLASLINKLDVLTHKSLAVNLNTEQKKKVRELVDKLDEREELSEEDARAKLDDLQKILTEDQRKTLQDAGFRSGQGGGGRGGRGGPPAPPPPNPFREGEAKEHLKSLRDQLEDKKTF